MKRSAELRDLSDDHHRALVLARHARHAATAGAPAVAEAWERIRTELALELEPHFRIEEAWLLPALARAGEGELAARTMEDHAALRAAAAPDAPRDAPALAGFGARLEAHVRFEERSLFPTAEARLAPAELAAVAAASRERARRPAGPGSGPGA